MSNPPYGLDWKEYDKAVPSKRASAAFPVLPRSPVDRRRADAVPVPPGAQDAGARGRWRPGRDRPERLTALQRRRRIWPVEDPAVAAGIDLVEAIVALPTNMFFNTGIATYIWILDNTKRAERKGKIQLIDGDLVLDEDPQEPRFEEPRGRRQRPRPNRARSTTPSIEADPDYSKVLHRRRLRLLDDHRRTPAARRGRQPGHRPQGQTKARCEEA